MQQNDLIQKLLSIVKAGKYSPDVVEYDSVYHDLQDDAEGTESENELVKEAKRIISTFNEREQQIIKMHYEEGLTFEKIARIENWNQESVRVWHLRSMRKIRK